MATAYGQPQYETAAFQRLEATKLSPPQVRALVYEFKSIHENIDNLDERLDRIDKRLDSMSKSMRDMHKWAGDILEAVHRIENGRTSNA